jgi:DSBA-like thioredoxin domain
VHSGRCTTNSWTHQDALEDADLVSYAEELRLDSDRFSEYLREHRGAAWIADDVDSADLSGVTGTPTFFINGRRHCGAYDIATLSDAVLAAGARARVAGDLTPRATGANRRGLTCYAWSSPKAAGTSCASWRQWPRTSSPLLKKVGVP